MRNVEVNTINARNIYPTAPGASLGVQGSAMSAYGYGAPQGGPMQNDNSSSGSSTVDYAAAVGLTGRPLNWWLVMFVMLILLMWGSKKLGTDGDFGNIKLSAYNVLTIGLASIIGISFFKMLFTKIPVPGLTTLVMAV